VEGGYGRWVRDVLVWTRAPFFRQEGLIMPLSEYEPGTAFPGVMRMAMARQ
jgi:hypothetical protein